jgi:hypothetical protein
VAGEDVDDSPDGGTHSRSERQQKRTSTRPVGCGRA